MPDDAPPPLLSPERRLRLLRLVLGCSAAGWGVTVVGVFLSWDGIVKGLKEMGVANTIVYDPFLEYWFRMSAGVFGLLGALFLAAAWDPRKYHAILPVFGWGLLGLGAIIAYHGLNLRLAPVPFYVDLAFCFIGGAAILALRDAAAPEILARNHQHEAPGD